MRCVDRQTLPALVLLTGFWMSFGGAQPSRAAVESEALPEPSLSSVNYEEAQRLLEKGRWSEAVVVLRHILKAESGFFPAQMDLSRALLHLGRRIEAIQILQQIAQRERPGRRALLEQRSRTYAHLFISSDSFQTYQDGLNLLEKRRFAEACRKFNQALSREAEHADILTRLGQCQVITGEPGAAVQNLRLARQLSPDAISVRLWLGRALSLSGESKSALAELRAATSEWSALEKAGAAPDFAVIWLAEALIQETGQAVPGAMVAAPVGAATGAAAQITPLESGPKAAAPSEVSAAGATEGAIQYLESNLKRVPRSPAARLFLGELKLKFSENQGNKNLRLLNGAKRDFQQALLLLQEPETLAPPAEYRVKTSEELKIEAQSLLKRVDEKLSLTAGQLPEKN